MEMWTTGLSKSDPLADCTLGKAMAAMPMEDFLNKAFRRGQWVFDEVEGVYVAIDPSARTGYAVVLEDRTILYRIMAQHEIN